MDKLINYAYLSVLLTGKSDLIRKNKVPKKYKGKIDALKIYLQYWEKDIQVVNKNKVDEIKNNLIKEIEKL
jgi:hypothetical protein